MISVRHITLITTIQACSHNAACRCLHNRKLPITTYVTPHACVIITGLIIVKWTNWQSSAVERRRERVVSPSHVYTAQLNSTQLPVELSWAEPCRIVSVDVHWALRTAVTWASNVKRSSMTTPSDFIADETGWMTSATKGLFSGTKSKISQMTQCITIL